MEIFVRLNSTDKLIFFLKLSEFVIKYNSIKGFTEYDYKIVKTIYNKCIQFKSFIRDTHLKYKYTELEIKLKKILETKWPDKSI